MMISRYISWRRENVTPADFIVRKYTLSQNDFAVFLPQIPLEIWEKCSEIWSNFKRRWNVGKVLKFGVD